MWVYVLFSLECEAQIILAAMVRDYSLLIAPSYKHLPTVAITQA